MSLLDAGVHVEDPALIVDQEAIFHDDMFYSQQYGTLHRRSASGTRGSRTSAAPDRESTSERDPDRPRERESLSREQFDRWWSNVHLCSSESGSSRANNSSSQDKGYATSRGSVSDPVTVADQLQWWPIMVCSAEDNVVNFLSYVGHFAVMPSFHIITNNRK